MKRLMLILALAPACNEVASAPDDKTGCVEFDHRTFHHGRPTICRMVWCEQTVMSTSGNMHATGGVATLWCDDGVSNVDAGAKGD